MLDFQQIALIQMADDTPADTAPARFVPRSFRYSYLCRLIDDSELRDFAPPVRAELRRLHKQAFWKNLLLLRRDANQILRVRRGKMSAQQQWDFSTLVDDYAKVQLLLATLTIAGLSHATRLSLGLDRARAACSEFESLFTSYQPLSATS